MVKEGDKVRVRCDISEKIKKGEIGGRVSQAGKELYFNEYSMKRYEGKEYEVKKVIEDSLEQIKLVGIDWSWREDWLEQVLPKELEEAVKLI